MPDPDGIVLLRLMGICGCGNCQRASIGTGCLVGRARRFPAQFFHSQRGATDNKQVAGCDRDGIHDLSGIHHRSVPASHVFHGQTVAMLSKDTVKPADLHVEQLQVRAKIAADDEWKMIQRRDCSTPRALCDDNFQMETMAGCHGSGMRYRGRVHWVGFTINQNPAAKGSRTGNGMISGEKSGEGLDSIDGLSQQERSNVSSCQDRKCLAAAERFLMTLGTLGDKENPRGRVALPRQLGLAASEIWG